MSNKNPFETGAVDKFRIQYTDVGEIEKIRIGHDNKGLASGWHLSKVCLIIFFYKLLEHL